MALLHKTQKQLLPSILFFFQHLIQLLHLILFFDETKNVFFTYSIIQTNYHMLFKTKKEKLGLRTRYVFILSERNTNFKFWSLRTKTFEDVYPIPIRQKNQYFIILMYFHTFNVEKEKSLPDYFSEFRMKKQNNFRIITSQSHCLNWKSSRKSLFKLKIIQKEKLFSQVFRTKYLKMTFSRTECPSEWNENFADVECSEKHSSFPKGKIKNRKLQD